MVRTQSVLVPCPPTALTPTIFDFVLEQQDDITCPCCTQGEEINSIYEDIHSAYSAFFGASVSSIGLRTICSPRIIQTDVKSVVMTRDKTHNPDVNFQQGLNHHSESKKQQVIMPSGKVNLEICQESPEEWDKSSMLSRSNPKQQQFATGKKSLKRQIHVNLINGKNNQDKNLPRENEKIGPYVGISKCTTNPLQLTAEERIEPSFYQLAEKYSSKSKSNQHLQAAEALSSDSEKSQLIKERNSPYQEKHSPDVDVFKSSLFKPQPHLSVKDTNDDGADKCLLKNGPIQIFQSSKSHPNYLGMIEEQPPRWRLNFGSIGKILRETLRKTNT